jgi:GNAT superfamily N-acetyltransferase
VSITVARANYDEFSELAGLRFQWRVDEADEHGLSRDEFDDRFRDWLHHHRESHRAFLARRDDVAIGCAWLCVIDRIPGPESFLRRGGMVQSVYVEPASRDQGVGGQLMQVLIDEARTMGLGYVLVHPSMRSFAFYRRLGFADAEHALELRFDR